MATSWAAHRMLEKIWQPPGECEPVKATPLRVELKSSQYNGSGHALMIVAWPNSPHRMMRGADSAIRLAMSPSSTSGFAPTSVTILPARRICMPPVSGASTAKPPMASTCARTAAVFSKSVVECSIHVAPFRRPAKMPLGPAKAAETSAGRGRAVMTTSAAAAASCAEEAQTAPPSDPRSGSGTFLSPCRSKSCSGTPLRSKLAPTAAPICWDAI